MNMPTIETAEQAEAALAELERVAEAIRETPGGKLATMAEARRFLDRADPEAMKLWSQTAKPEIGVMFHIIGKVLKLEATAADLKVFAHKARVFSSWKGALYGLGDNWRDFPKLDDATEAGEFLKALGEQIYEDASARVRYPAPGVGIEEGYRGDGY